MVTNRIEGIWTESTELEMRKCYAERQAAAPGPVVDERSGNSAHGPTTLRGKQRIIPIQNVDAPECVSQ